MLQNRPELVRVLRGDPDRIGRVFARHAYGMQRWVDAFSMRVAAIADPEAKQVVAELVADNARHMNLFRARARAHGVDPDRYSCPPEGELIYTRIEAIGDVAGVAAYATGSLGHFTELLDAYAAAATGEDVRAIREVRADVERMRRRLAPLLSGGEALASEAHELYRRRELVETGTYADAA
jgi:hypothetical protein